MEEVIVTQSLPYQQYQAALQGVTSRSPRTAAVIAQQRQLRLELVRALFDCQCVLDEVCPQCQHVPSLNQLYFAFAATAVQRRDQSAVLCPQCSHQYRPQVRWQEQRRLYLLSPQVVRQRLPALATCHQDPAVWRMRQAFECLTYWSAIFHFGSLQLAMRLTGCRHTVPEEFVAGWQERITPLLGSIPDRQIGRVTGYSTSTVQKWRYAAAQPAYHRGRILPWVM